jgi:hypothetical protein
MAHMTEWYNEQVYLFEQVAIQNTVISLKDHADLVSTLIK